MSKPLYCTVGLCLAELRLYGLYGVEESPTRVRLKELVGLGDEVISQLPHHIDFLQTNVRQCIA